MPPSMPRSCTDCSSACIGRRPISRRPGWSRTSSGVVRIMTPPSLATHWLMPRLPALIEAHPGVDSSCLCGEDRRRQRRGFRHHHRLWRRHAMAGTGAAIARRDDTALLRARTARRRDVPDGGPAAVAAPDPEPGECGVLGKLVWPARPFVRQVRTSPDPARPVLCGHRGGGQGSRRDPGEQVFSPRNMSQRGASLRRCRRRDRPRRPTGCCRFTRARGRPPPKPIAGLSARPTCRWRLRPCFVKRLAGPRASRPAHIHNLLCLRIMSGPGGPRSGKKEKSRSQAARSMVLMVSGGMPDFSDTARSCSSMTARA